MTGREQFARAVLPGSATVLAAVGDARNALLRSVEADLGAGPVTLPAARRHLLDERARRPRSGPGRGGAGRGGDAGR